MHKQKLTPRTLLGPVPPALISCGGTGGEKNIITLAWVGVANSEPPMIAISIRPSRYSYQMVKETGEFVVNLPAKNQVRAVDFCGTVSGKKVDKFARLAWEPEQGTLQYAPLIKECPVNLECRVEHSLLLGSHEMFVGRVVAAYADPAVLGEQGKIDFRRCHLLGFCDGRYLAVESLDLNLGFSLKQ